MTVSLPSLEPVIENVATHLRQHHDTALVAAPGSGASTAVQKLTAELQQQGVDVMRLDMKTARLAEESLAALQALIQSVEGEKDRVAVIDHAAGLSANQLGLLLDAAAEAGAHGKATCLWLGPLDARRIEAETGKRIHAVPRSHVSFPLLPRDELLALYRSIGEAARCKWGEPILFLLLDLCGNDLSLVHSATEYLYGDWTSKLYDENIWDRVGAWLREDAVVNQYRTRLAELPELAREYLRLLRLGGKPPCQRPDVLEELDDALRLLWLQGFLVPNLLPGFYQLRNLTMRVLISEADEPWSFFGPDFLFRRSNNERIGQLLQDAETMLRGLLLAVFHRIGPERVEQVLRGKQSDREFMPGELNKAILQWADEQGGVEAKASLNAILVDHRKAFREGNSVWANVERMMTAFKPADEQGGLPAHLRSIDFLTFNELSVVLLDLLDDVFPGVPLGVEKKRLQDRWRENMARIQRLRNTVAHLRNVEFRDMEGLAGIVETMRNDLRAYAQWR